MNSNNSKSSGRQLHQQRLLTHVKMAQTVSESSGNTLMSLPNYRSPCNSSAAHQPKSPIRTLDPPPSQQQQHLLTSSGGVPTPSASNKPQRASLKQRTSRQDNTLLANFNNLKQPLSVANFLSPTRSSLAMQVKPLFANRDKTNHARQSCSFTKNSTRNNNKGSTTRSSKLNLRPQGLIQHPANSSTFNSWTEEDSDSYDQPPHMTMMSSDQGSTPSNQQQLLAANSQSKKVFQIKAIATAQEAQMTQAEKKQQTCQIEQQKHSNSTFSLEQQKLQQKQQMLIQQYQDEDSCEVGQMYTTEPVAQELPMQAKKIKSCAYRKTSAQVGVRHHKDNNSRMRDNSRTTNQSSAYNAALSIQENIMSPAVQAQSSLFNLIKTHKNTNSFSKQQTLSVLSHSSIETAQRRRRTQNNNTCSSILLNKVSHLRASSIGSSCKSSQEIAASQNSNSDTAGASQATKRLKKKVVRHQPLLGSLECSVERDPGFSTLNSRVCQSNQTQSHPASTSDKNQNKTNVISQQTSKNHRLGSKERITLIQNKAKQIHAGANKSPHARAKQYTRNTMITSPVRHQTQTYQSGVLHQKQRKTSAKNTSTCGNTVNNTQQKTSAYVTLQNSNLPTSSTLNSLAATSTTKSPNMFQQYKTISNPPSSMNSLSLKNFVESYQNTNNEKQHSNQVVLRGKRSNRGHMAVACPPDISLNSTIVKPTKDALNASSQSRAALKKRRSQEDSSTRRLITPGVGSPGAHLPQSQVQQEPPQVKKCQLNKGIRSLLQKSKSQSRMNNRQPLSEVSNNTGNTGPGGIVMSTLEDTAEDDPDNKQELFQQTSKYNDDEEQEDNREQETTRIDILANANNYTEEDSIPQERPKVNQAPRGDNTPLSDTLVTGTHIGTCKQSPLHLMIPSPLEQKMTSDQAPNSISTKKVLTGKNLTQKYSGQNTSQANFPTRRTTPQNVDSAMIDWQNVSSHPASSKTYNTTTTSLGGAGFGGDSTPSLHLHQQDITPPTNASPLETPPVPQEYSKHAIKRQRPCLNSSDQNTIVEQHQAPNQNNEDEVSLDPSDQDRLIYHTIQHKRESDQQTEKQNMLITNHYMPEKLTLQNNRRKRSQRVRQNGQQQSQTSSQSQTQQQQPPVVTLNLVDAQQKKKRQVMPQVLITKLEESTASAQREAEQTQGQLEKNCFQIVEQQPPQLQQCASQVSFAAGAENCQGGMTMHFMDEAEGQKARTPDMPEQALQKPLSRQLFSELCDEGENQIELKNEETNLTSSQNDHQNNFNDQQLTTSQAKKQAEKQQSDLLPNFYPNPLKQRALEEDFHDDQVPGISFNDILQVRDREISTKSPEPCIIENLRMPSSELTNNDSSCKMSSAPRVPILDRNTASHPITPLTNDTPYQQIKSIKKQVPERLEERTICMVKSKSHMRGDQFLTPGGKRNNNALTSKKLSRNSACLSPTGQLKALINRDSSQQCNTMTALAKRTKHQMPTLKTRNQSSGSVKTRGLSKAKQTGEDNQPKTQVPSVRQSLQKSHSQINQGSRQMGLHHQKLFQVSNKNQPLTPQKQDLSISRRMANDTQSKLMRRMRSQDRLSQNAADNVSQTRQNRSPGAKSGVSGGNLSVHQPSMFVLRSTKKLTQFREFAITPTGNQSGSCGGNAFISPLKLKKLEKKHGVSLLGKEPTTNNEDDNQDCEDQKVVSLTEKHQTLLQDNEAMDAYMKDLCNKYF